jgi:hypothetical protein
MLSRISYGWMLRERRRVANFGALVLQYLAWKEYGKMLWKISIVLLVLWALGLVTSYTFGGFIYILLFVGLVVLAIHIFQARRVA